MQYQFGTGTLWGAAIQDALGNTIANPTPVKFGTLNDVSLEIDRDLKELYGQLAFRVAAGVYTFAAADATKTVYISYTYTYALTTARSVTFNNIAMGTVPIFGLDLSCRFNGKQAYFRLNQCTAKKLSIDPKQDDYTM